MAAGSLPAPGIEFGPCEDEQCGHVDCDANRILAAQPCKHCEEPIGYDRPFYQDGTWTELEHQICAIRKTEESKTQRSEEKA